MQTNSDSTASTEGPVDGEQVQCAVLTSYDIDDEVTDVEQLRNPPDAVQILARTSQQSDSHRIDAVYDTFSHTDCHDHIQEKLPRCRLGHTYSAQCSQQRTTRLRQEIQGYELVAQGLLDTTVVQRLIHL